MRILIITFFIFSFTCSQAQEYEPADDFDALRYKPFFTFRNMLLSEDYLMGLELGIISPAENLTFFGSFDFRPFRKKIFNYQGGNLYYQNAEQRFFIGAGAEYMHYMNEQNYGVFAQLSGSYTWAYYGGTEVIPPKGFVLNPKAGAFWRFAPSFVLKGGYAYQDTKNDRVEAHKLYLALSAIIAPR